MKLKSGILEVEMALPVFRSFIIYFKVACNTSVGTRVSVILSNFIRQKGNYKEDEMKSLTFYITFFFLSHCLHFLYIMIKDVMLVFSFRHFKQCLSEYIMQVLKRNVYEHLHVSITN
jgi:hypothetical protein